MILLSLLVAIVSGVRWYVSLVLIGIALAVTDVEHMFIYVLFYCISSFEKKVYSVFPPFLHQVVFLLLIYMDSLCILDINHLLKDG